MKDTELADEIIARLNNLIQHSEVRQDVSKLIETRIPCSEATQNHPTIQAGEGLGFLGLLNGIVGVIPDGKKEGWGYITAKFDDQGKLTQFCRTFEK